MYHNFFCAFNNSFLLIMHVPELLLQVHQHKFPLTIRTVLQQVIKLCIASLFLSLSLSLLYTLTMIFFTSWLGLYCIIFFPYQYHITTYLLHYDVLCILKVNGGTSWYSLIIIQVWHVIDSFKFSLVLQLVKIQYLNGNWIIFINFDSQKSKEKRTQSSWNKEYEATRTPSTCGKVLIQKFKTACVEMC